MGFVGVGIPGQGLGLPAKQGGERGCEKTEIFDEPMIKVAESLKLLDRLRGCPFPDCFHLPLVHLDTLLTDDIAEELHGGAMELTFL